MLTPEDTPGGGLTMVVRLPIAPEQAPPPPNAAMESQQQVELPPGVARWIDERSAKPRPRADEPR